MEICVENRVPREVASPPQEEKDGVIRMTPAYLRQHCRDLKLYSTPELNEVLYLHFKGFRKIENLEEYVGVRTLWLESNGISSISGLDSLTDLRCLFLQQNCIREIQGLESLLLLDTLNLSNNLVTQVKGLPLSLTNLQLTHNRLRTIEDISALSQYPNLSIVDLSYNRLEDAGVVTVFGAMPTLGVLYLVGNPCIRKIDNYRRNMVVKCTKLKYLDDRPVFDKERAMSEAWSRGGLEAEREVREEWNQREQDKIRNSVNAMIALRDRKMAERAEKERHLAESAESSASEPEIQTLKQGEPEMEVLEPKLEEPGPEIPLVKADVASKLEESSQISVKPLGKLDGRFSLDTSKPLELPKLTLDMIQGSKGQLEGFGGGGDGPEAPEPEELSKDGQSDDSELEEIKAIEEEESLQQRMHLLEVRSAPEEASKPEMKLSEPETLEISIPDLEPYDPSLIVTRPRCKGGFGLFGIESKTRGKVIHFDGTPPEDPEEL